MRNRNRTVRNTLGSRAVLWIAETLLGSIPVVGPVFTLAFMVLEP